MPVLFYVSRFTFQSSFLRFTFYVLRLSSSLIDIPPGFPANFRPL